MKSPRFVDSLGHPCSYCWQVVLRLNYILLWIATTFFARSMVAPMVHLLPAAAIGGPAVHFLDVAARYLQFQ